LNGVVYICPILKWFGEPDVENFPSFEINNLGSVFKQKFLVHNLTFQKIENVFHQPASIGKIVVSIIFVQLGDKDSGFCY